MPTTVRSHAKINLGLGIGAPRADGFHALTTVYQTLEIHDLVTVKAPPAVGPTSIHITSNDRRVPTDERNTAWKMVKLALEALGISAAVEIEIEKRLPVQGGLGAGSANAVAALVGLVNELERQGIGNREQGIGASSAEGWILRSENPDLGTPGSGCGDSGKWASTWLEIAAQVGSDVPLFLDRRDGFGGGSRAGGLSAARHRAGVVRGGDAAIGVSTPQAFRDWDALCTAEGLTAAASTDKLNELSRAYASAFGGIPEGQRRAGSSGVLFDEENLAGPQESALVRTGITSWIQNDFERVVFPQYPSLAEIKCLLAASGTPEAALFASLSGSGSALFGLYLAREDAEKALVRLQSRSKGWKCGAR